MAHRLVTLTPLPLLGVLTHLITYGCAASIAGCLDRPPGLPNQDEGLLAARSEHADAGANPSPDGGSASPDPESERPAGPFSLEAATAGLTGNGVLVASIETNKGVIRCELFDDRAPLTVANFVGLARGLRAFKSRADGGRWVKRPAYDGTTFHRVIAGFMIQGGDPEGNGKGEPGYVIPDEIWPGSTHDRAGQLCMANRGPNTNGMQFFITDAPVERLDGSYTIFGQCEPASVVHTIATVPKTSSDRPSDPVKIEKVSIARTAPTPAPPSP